MEVLTEHKSREVLTELVTRRHDPGWQRKPAEGHSLCNLSAQAFPLGHVSCS